MEKNEKNVNSTLPTDKMTRRQELAFVGVFLIIAGLLVFAGLYKPAPVIYSFPVNSDASSSSESNIFNQTATAAIATVPGTDTISESFNDTDSDNLYFSSFASVPSNVTRSESTGTTAQSDDSIININSATAEQLTVLPGIGETLSQRIVDYRNTNGIFSTTYEITNVSGIGDGIYNKIKEYITVDN